jgi:hypothetical protein
MNIAYEDDELKPYIEPLRDMADSFRIGIVDKLTRQLFELCGVPASGSHATVVRTAVFLLSFFFRNSV